MLNIIVSILAYQLTRVRSWVRLLIVRRQLRAMTRKCTATA